MGKSRILAVAKERGNLFKMVKCDSWLKNLYGQNVNPASVDLTLGLEARIFTWQGEEDENGDPLIVQRSEILAEPMWLFPGEMALLHSQETVYCPPDKAALILLKSSRGREGFDHSFSGWVDPGFKGQIVFEVYANAIPIKLVPGMKIVQIIYMDCDVPDMTYDRTGHYQNQTGARQSVFGFVPSSNKTVAGAICQV